MRYICFIACICCLLGSCRSRELMKANKAYQKNHFAVAAESYKKLYSRKSTKKSPKRPVIAFRLAECYRHNRQPARSINYYKQAIRYQYPDSIPYLRLAQMLQQSGKYAEAISWYDLFLTSWPDHSLALSGKEGCHRNEHWSQNLSSFIIKKVDILTSNRSDQYPAFYGQDQDLIYFSSSRIRDKKEPTDPGYGTPYRRIYHSRKDKQENWQKPEFAEIEMNHPGVDNPTFSPDGQVMYYTRPVTLPDKSTVNRIYQSQRTQATWSTGEECDLSVELPFCTEDPFITTDGQWLYFVSDKPGGIGGKDIYRIQRLKKGWGALEHLGQEINTAGDERSPYLLHPDTLWFASGGHPGMGGLDLFTATRKDRGGWNIENAGIPLNSPADDHGIIFYPGGKKGYFTSNRNDHRGYNSIYYFEKTEKRITLQGSVKNKEEEVIPDAFIYAVNQDGFNKKIPVTTEGDYRLSLQPGTAYIIMAGATGFENQSLTFEIDPQEDEEWYQLDFRLQPVIENLSYIFYFPYGRSEITPDELPRLEELIHYLKENPEYHILLEGHTDHHGGEDYNKALSLQRTENIARRLLQNNISKGRIKQTGFGKEKPFHTDEDHLNRRVEVSLFK